MLINLTLKAIKQLKKIPKKDKQKIMRKIKFLSQDPLIGKLLEGGFKGFRSIRAWPYRIIYKLEKNKITIFSVAHRQSVYN